MRGLEYFRPILDVGNKYILSKSSRFNQFISFFVVQNLFVKFTRALQGDFYKHFTSSRMNLNSYVLVVTKIMISTCHEYPDWNTCILLAHNERFNFLKLLTDTKFVPSKLFNFPNWKGWKVKISCKVTGCHGKLMNFMQLCKKIVLDVLA